MRTNGKRNIAALVSIAAIGTIGLSACSSEDGGSSEAGNMSASSEMSSDMSSDMQADPAANLVGPGCGAYAEQNPSGSGSVEGMAQDPVATAASNNPMLTTLTKAVSGQVNPDVNLVDTLNGGQFTVFAPTDDAFAKVDDDTMSKLSTDSDALTSLLTYHVVPGQLTPDEVAGMHETVEGDQVDVEGSGDDLTVDDAHVVCGGVQTANATVYLIDGVLMPS